MCAILHAGVLGIITSFSFRSYLSFHSPHAGLFRWHFFWSIFLDGCYKINLLVSRISHMTPTHTHHALSQKPPSPFPSLHLPRDSSTSSIPLHPFMPPFLQVVKSSGNTQAQGCAHLLLHARPPSLPPSLPPSFPPSLQIIHSLLLLPKSLNSYIHPLPK